MNDTDLDTLVHTFCDGRTPGKQDFNASKMYSLLEEPFTLWCSFHAPADQAVYESNRYEVMKVRSDRRSRDEWIRTQYPQAVFISAQEEADRFTQTLQQMAAGASAIVDGVLWNLPNNIYGGVNLLVREDTAPSRFGPYHYRLCQFKRAHDLKEHYALQVCLLNKILAAIQQYTPEAVCVYLKGRTEQVNYLSHTERLSNELDFWRNIRDGIAQPEAHKPPKAASAPWRIYANKLLFQTHDLQLLPELSAQMRQCLKICGIRSIDDVAATPIDTLRTILEEPYATHAYCTAQAYVHQKPVLREAGCFPPPVKKRNLYFDFEATEIFGKDNSSFVYLIGIWDKEEDKYVRFVARTAEQEIDIFEQFYHYVADFENTILYHWTDYEVRKMRKMASAHPEHAEHLHALCNCCYDLKVAVNRAFYLPAPSFSLKAAAPAFGFQWRQDDCGAMDSMVYFNNWLKTGDDELLNKILIYNEDDCKAMLYLENKLKESTVIQVPL